VSVLPDPLRVVVGVDGGGSKTACRVAATDGAPLAEGSAGPSNYQSVGQSGALAALATAIEGAAADVGRPLHVVGLCLALAGVDRPADLEALRRVAGNLLERPVPGVTWGVGVDQVVIVNDATAALVGGTGRPFGVVCVAGTGSIAFGVNRTGERARAGGWGHLLGDEGSGYAIGLEALRAVCRASDGRGPRTALTERVLARCGLPDASGLIGLAYGGWGPADVAAFAPGVGRASEEEDAVAQAILDRAGDELAMAAHSVASRLGFLEPAGGPFPVVTAGGLWEGLPRLRSRFGAVLRNVAPAAQVLAPRETPVAGAVRLALQAAGLLELDPDSAPGERD
jgi:N-acetylglucosamine kinase-like BadF-type ATPase